MKTELTMSKLNRYTNKNIGTQRFLDYLHPSYFNEMPLHLKINIFYSVSNNYIINKKYIVN